MSGPVQCVWFKRDLRVLDHAPLKCAAERGPVVAVYLIEPAVIDAPDFDAMHWNFIRESLRELQESLRDLGTELQIFRGDAVELFAALQEQHAIETIWAHEETGNAVTYKRDLAVGAWAKAAGVRFEEISQNGVVRGLKDRDGWARHWERWMGAAIEAVPEKLESAAGLKPCGIPSAGELKLDESTREVDLRGGEKEAIRMLESFVKGRGVRYHREMSSPNTAYESCSRLSPYLAWGCISMRSVVQSVRAAAGESMPKIAARAFLSRCHWHCHFMQKLESEPEIEFHAFNRACDDLRRGEVNTERLIAWKSGRTGYPFIDACIRSLKARGWINFRMRAMLVSFASYHLWLDWRVFKDWLACQFVDYEPGIHISQVQMQSGLTGINTLRIYNPIKQGQDHDPEGEFIRTWVPELKDVATIDIHEPWKMPELIQIESNCRIGVDYPYPIVDHKEAVKQARAHFAALRKRDDYWQAARAVIERHGSRKSRESRKRPQRPKCKISAQTEMNLGESQN
jgi:deoxyribodipyrimidine photo-lyase